MRFLGLFLSVGIILFVRVATISWRIWVIGKTILPRMAMVSRKGAWLLIHTGFLVGMSGSLVVLGSRFLIVAISVTLGIAVVLFFVLVQSSLFISTYVVLERNQSLIVKRVALLVELVLPGLGKAIVGVLD
jgi:hypothetical protein